MSQEFPRFLTVAETARVLKVSRNTIYRWIRSGRLRAWKVKRKMLVDPDDIVDRLEEVVPSSEVERVRRQGVRLVLKKKED